MSATITNGRSIDEAAAGSPRRWGTAARAALTVAILGYLFSNVDLARWGEELRNSKWEWIAVALLANGLLVLVSTYKWNVLLRGLGVRASGWKLLKWYLIGMFMSAGLPGQVGGDAVRWHIAGSVTGNRLKVGATILAERVLGVVAMVTLCLIMVAFDWRRLATLPVLTLCCGVTLALIGGLTIALSRRLNVNFRYRTRRSLLRRTGRLAHRLHQTFRAFPWSSIVIALIHSFLFYLLGGAALYFICLAFSVELSLIDAIAVQSLMCVLLLLPISLGGLGLPQAGDIYLFAQYGVAPETALGISVTRLVLYYAFVMVGGTLFIQRRERVMVDAGTAPAD